VRAVGRRSDGPGYPAATWTIADLTDLLSQRSWSVSSATVYRPRHHLRHRQDAEAVASAQHTLEVLQNKGALTAADCVCSTSTSANFIPTWQKGGSNG